MNCLMSETSLGMAATGCAVLVFVVVEDDEEEDRNGCRGWRMSRSSVRLGLRPGGRLTPGAFLPVCQRRNAC